MPGPLPCARPPGRPASRGAAAPTTYAEPSIEDYAQRATQTVASWTSVNGKQGGDPVKLADALIKLVSQDEAPVRWVAGADAVQTVGNKGRDLIVQADAYRDLSSSLALNCRLTRSG